MLPVAVAQSFSDESTIRYVLPVLWITSCFYIIRRRQRLRERISVRHVVIYFVHCVSSSSAGSGTGQLSLASFWGR